MATRVHSADANVATELRWLDVRNLKQISQPKLVFLNVFLFCKTSSLQRLPFHIYAATS